MVAVFITIDTELNVALHRSGVSLADNLAIAVDAQTPRGSFGVGYQIQQLKAHGLKAIFFVDAFCAYVYGDDALRQIVTPIVDAGHEVQLHIHTEWLPYFVRDPVSGRRGQNIADFDVNDQQRLIELGIAALERAGAGRPVAFRAGNFGANDDTLVALGRAGLHMDSSYNGAQSPAPCRIKLAKTSQGPLSHMGVLEFPVSLFDDQLQGLRPLQLCAVSFAEMRHFLLNAERRFLLAVTIVSHSFELINRARRMPNPVNVTRFEKLCAFLGERKSQLPTVGYAGRSLDQVMNQIQRPLSGSAHRTVGRLAEQILSRLLYERPA